QHAAARFMRSQTPIEFEYSFFFATIFRYYTVTVTPDADAGGRTIFAIERTQEMPYEKLQFGDPSPESVWLAPFYALKPNYHAPGDEQHTTNNFGFWDHSV